MGLFDIFRKKEKTAFDSLEDSPAYLLQKALAGSCDDGVDADEMPNGHGEYGLSTTKPIPCHTIPGGYQYLESLCASDGTKIKYERIGSFSSDVSPHLIDGYVISDLNGQELATLYISPYQKRNSGKAPKGFKLI